MTRWLWRTAAAALAVIGAPFGVLACLGVLADDAAGCVAPYCTPSSGVVSFLVAAGLFTAAGACWRKGEPR
jgi:hypothetical protein